MPFLLRRSCAGLLVLLGIAEVVTAQTPPESSSVEYNRDIRPILSDKCFRCHGPDRGNRKAGLRLDRQEDAVLEREGTRAVAPGNPEESEAFARIIAEDQDERMPPHGSGLTLSPKEIEQIRRWIAQGAKYQPHWAFVPPRSPGLPEVKRSGWARNDIDYFVQAELEHRGLEPSTEASRNVLLRRVALDLTGLPPAPEEIDAFLADRSPDAYDRAVDRLLASPHFGERLALDWLDSARYADTNGYYTDAERRVWPWRDWVINAFNQNKPFDQFTIEQIAGDLLPKAAASQRIATGFNRNHMVTNESGVIDEECRIGYVVDRVDTTSTVWLGLTISCARCHDHKYDPISQENYYKLFACFNNVPEKGLVKDPINPPPVISLPTADQEQWLAELGRQRSQCEGKLRVQEPAFSAAMSAWETTAVGTLPPVPTDGSAAYFDLDRDDSNRGSQRPLTNAVGTLPFTPGVKGSAVTFDATQYIEYLGPPGLDTHSRFSVSMWVKPGSGPTGCLISKAASTPDARGFEVMWYKSQPRIHLVHEWGKSAIEVFAKSTFPTGEWRHLVIGYDGSGKAAGLTVYVDGILQPLVVRRDDLSGSIATAEPWRLAWKGSGVGFEGGLDEIRLYDRVLGAGEAEAICWNDLIQGAVATPKASRAAFQKERLRKYFLAHHASDELRRLAEQVDSLRADEAEARKGIISSPVMEELKTPRTAFVLMRGQYDKPGQAVVPDVPSALGTLPSDAPRNRLGLARWLVDPANPLTARVAVNRYWQVAFGEGLVRTPNDFGLQGELPTHPQLLDWLAVTFVRSGWDVKALMKMLVTSATYRQAANYTPALLAHDPENKLLGRGFRHRLPAELIRDQALALGGLLVERVGGPSVKPYQPAGLWEAVSYNGDQSYVQDHGDSLHRRSLYTFWKRQAPPPAMLTFDAPTRETCTVKRARTNTPLQALVLLNDVTFLEAARGLGARMMRAGKDPATSLRFGFKAATGRQPKGRELAALERFYREQLAANAQQTQRAEEILSNGEIAPDRSLDPCELAAWTMTATILLNLDETITRH